MSTRRLVIYVYKNHYRYNRIGFGESSKDKQLEKTLIGTAIGGAELRFHIDNPLKQYGIHVYVTFADRHKLQIEYLRYCKFHTDPPTIAPCVASDRIQNEIRRLEVFPMPFAQVS